MNLNIFKYSKHIAPLLIFFVICATSAVQAQQMPTRSDYQIVQGFNKEYSSLSDGINNATTVDGINAILSKINSFDSEYSAHKDLLDKALYPATYEQKIQELKARAQTSDNQLVTIQEQSQKLAQLNQQVADYAGQLKTLSEKSEGLQKEMIRSKGNESHLARLVKQYRESLKERDALISSMIDSLMVTYKNLSLPSLKGLETARAQALTDSKGNALKLIQSIADENTKFIDSHPTLTADEYLRMYAVQEQFSDMWNTVGDKMLSIYSNPKERAQEKTTIDNSLSGWHSKVSDYTFKSMASSFKEKGINLPEFNDSNSFYSGLRTYLDNAIKRSREHAGDAEYKEFQNFSDLWNNVVKVKWADNLVQGKILTYENIATIDQNLTTWGQLAQPKSYAMFIYLGIALIIIIIMGFLLYKAKSTESDKG